MIAAVNSLTTSLEPQFGSSALHSPDVAPTQWSKRESRVTIIDDEEINVEIAKLHLQLDGYQEFRCFTDPVDALTRLATEATDIVLLDIQMPKLNGLDLLKAIRNNESTTNVPVVMMSAVSDKDTRKQAWELGATDFIHKPIDEVELVARISNVLAVKSYEKQLQLYSKSLENMVRERTRDLEASRKEIIHCLACAGEYRDDDTGNHVMRVGTYARIIGAELGLPPQQVEALESAAQLHDIGKIGIPDAILQKPGRLTDEEFEFIQRHCGFGKKIIQPLGPRESNLVGEHSEIGAKILSRASSPILQLASTIALTHHERWDGTGYPLGLAGEDIPLEGRITAVADVFDALSSKRVYKDALPISECFDIISQGSGSQFDPDCVDAFFRRKADVVDTQIRYADCT